MKVSEKTVRSDIAMMRSMASHKPISPFHLAVADEMEKMLKELLELRKLKRKWVGLTDEEIDAIEESTWDADHKVWGIHNFARNIEAKLRERNT